MAGVMPQVGGGSPFRWAEIEARKNAEAANMAERRASAAMSDIVRLESARQNTLLEPYVEMREAEVLAPHVDRIAELRGARAGRSRATSVDTSSDGNQAPATAGDPGNEPFIVTDTVIENTPNFWNDYEPVLGPGSVNSRGQQYYRRRVQPVAGGNTSDASTTGVDTAATPSARTAARNIRSGGETVETVPVERPTAPLPTVENSTAPTTTDAARPRVDQDERGWFILYPDGRKVYQTEIE